MKRIAPPLASAAILLALAAATLFAQQPPVTPVASEPASQPGRYVGVASCVNSGCHGSTQPLDATRVLQNEYYTWLNNDRHAGAYNVLFNDRSARIVRNMRLRKRAYEETLCLDCHTTNVAAAQVAGHVDVEDGIQCELCHGPASGWRDEHAQEGWTHAQSVARGMTDLQRVDTRAQLCVGCHVGGAKKEVDHELIASGHPLLAFELDNYTESMPPHWTPNRATHGAPAWATGQLVTFATSLDNLARHARADRGPEFSDMSCFNCHHDLQENSERQARGWPDRAGLPAWSPRYWSVLRLIIGRTSPRARDALDPLVAQIARGVSRMNDPGGVAANADRAKRIVAPLVSSLAGQTWDDAAVRSLMRTITDDPLVATDVHSAEQAALSLQSLATVLTRRNPRLMRGAMSRSIDALFEEVRVRNDYDPARFAKKLDAVSDAIAN